MPVNKTCMDCGVNIDRRAIRCHPCAMKAIHPWNKGKTLSESTCNKIRMALLGNKNHFGHKPSEDARQRMRLKALGQKRCLGHKHSIATKQLISIRSRQYYATHPSPMKGKRHRPETIALLRKQRTQEDYRLSRSGSHCNLYKGGQSQLPHNANWKYVRKKILARDNYICQIPECRISGINDILAVHHIDYIPTNDNPENLITLCPHHHSQSTAGDRVAWTMFLQDLRAHIRRPYACECYPN